MTPGIRTGIFSPSCIIPFLTTIILTSSEARLFSWWLCSELGDTKTYGPIPLEKVTMLCWLLNERQPKNDAGSKKIGNKWNLRGFRHGFSVERRLPWMWILRTCTAEQQHHQRSRSPRPLTSLWFQPSPSPSGKPMDWVSNVLNRLVCSFVAFSPDFFKIFKCGKASSKPSNKPSPSSTEMSGVKTFPNWRFLVLGKDSTSLWPGHLSKASFLKRKLEDGQSFQSWMGNIWPIWIQSLDHMNHLVVSENGGITPDHPFVDGTWHETNHPASYWGSTMAPWKPPSWATARGRPEDQIPEAWQGLSGAFHSHGGTPSSLDGLLNVYFMENPI